MRFHPKSALLLLLSSLLAIPAARAQQNQERPHATHRATPENPSLPHGPRPLTLDEGLAIISAALDSRHHAAFKSDCSHFVHGLYQRAGFPYTYAPSSDLYVGIDEFRRVTNPQPGDLAVWRGHSGIVINPVQHSFFSLLRSGPGVDSYDSPYWKRKGRPRFFRYVKTVPGGVLSRATRTASLKPTSLEDAEPHQAPTDDPESEISEGTSSERRSERTSPASRVANPALDPITPRVAVVNSVHPKPDQVAEAFIRACADSEPSLRGRDLFHSAQRVIVFEHFTVKKVHLAGSQDWVDVQIDELVSLTGGTAQAHKHSERQRWPLTRHDQTSWELTLPQDAIYLPQPIAVRLLAQQLAKHTEERPAPASRAEENAELARLLDVLLQK
jgi:hypothetical protein